VSTLSRFVSIAAVAATAAALLPGQALPAGRGSSSALATLGSGVLAQLNQIRVAHGLVAVKVSAALSAAADQHAAEMLAEGYFAHSSPDGLSFWKRIERFYPSAEHRLLTLGENLLWTSMPLDAKGALDLWMASPEHRANILLPSWREIGIAARHEPDAPGTFGGNSVTLVATEFGVGS
jgi:uncharacterized protein YkwD